MRSCRTGSFSPGEARPGADDLRPALENPAARGRPVSNRRTDIGLVRSPGKRGYRSEPGAKPRTTPGLRTPESLAPNGPITARGQLCELTHTELLNSNRSLKIRCSNTEQGGPRASFP